MKLSKLTQAVSIALTALALSACGGSDDGMIYNTDTTTPAPTPTTDSTTTPTAPTDAERLASIIAAAKAAGLNDANAQKFAEAVKELAQDSEAYATALTAALEAQKLEIENATKPVSETVVKNNHFIFKVDATKELSSGSEFYIRQPGSTYDRTANKREVSGLGGIATDDPTGDNGNPWLSNFVLGVETFQGKLRAIDSTGEMALPIDSSNRGQKIGAAESLYAKRDGLRYNTTRKVATPDYDYEGQRDGDDYKNPNFASSPLFYIKNRGGVDGTHAPIADEYDFAYDYSEVDAAPVRNTDWIASKNIPYTNKTWDKWRVQVTRINDENWQYNHRRECNNPNDPTDCSNVYDSDALDAGSWVKEAADQETKGDFTPWFTGRQTIRGTNHKSRTDNSSNYDPHTNGTDGYRGAGSHHIFTVKGNRDGAPQNTDPAVTTAGTRGESAYWDGTRVYRRHWGENGSIPRANNTVDESEDAYLPTVPNSLNGGIVAVAPDCTGTGGGGVEKLKCEQATIDFEGKFNNPNIQTGEYGSGLAVNANLEDAFGRKIYTIQEINRRKVKVSSEAVTDAETFAKFVGNQAAFAGLTTTSQAITAPGMRQDVAAGATAGNHSYKVNMDPYYTIRKQDGSVVPADIEKQRRYDTGLIVYSSHSKVVNGDERTYGYKKPIFGIEENVYVKDKDNKLKVVNHIYDETLLATLSNDSVKDPTKINDDPNSFFSVAKEKRLVYHQPCTGNSYNGTGDCSPYERKGYDWDHNNEKLSVSNRRNNSGWDEHDYYSRVNGNIRSLNNIDTNDSTDADGIGNLADTRYGAENGFRPANWSLGGVVSTETWKRMQPWQRLTVLRESRNPLETGVDAAKVANNLETRVYGKNYRDLETGAEGFQDTHNSYVGNYETKTDADGKEIEHQMTKIVPEKLHHVQYGRITNNIDILTQAEMEKVKEDDEARIIYRQFQEHGAANSVDTYFYRGTNRTTMAQMEAVRAKGGVIDYRGHALTYNLGPIVEKANTIPTAYGQDHGATIGNFVQAKFDTATGKVDGSIYNFLNTDVSADANKFMRQDLVTFNGDVYGNTVTGTATKLGITPETGTLTASFYGESANELGGAVNSLTREQGYGDAKWGAVFGATHGTMVDQFNIIESNTPNRP